MMVGNEVKILSFKYEILGLSNNRAFFELK